MSYAIANTDSSALSRLENRTRTRLFNSLFKAIPVVKSGHLKFRKDYDDHTSAFLLGYNYLVDRQYEQIDDISQEIEDAKDESVKDFFFDQANLAFMYMRQVQETPISDFYHELLTKITDIFVKYQSLEKTDQRVTTMLYEILEALQEYTLDTAQFFDDGGLTDHESLKAYMQNETYSQSSPTDSDARTEIEATIDNQLQQLAYLFADARTYTEAIKFMLTPSLGSAGIAYIGSTKFPLTLNAMQYKQSILNSSTYWNLRNNSDPQYMIEPIDTKSVNDDVLQILEGYSHQSLSTDNYRDHRSLINEKIQEVLYPEEDKPKEDESKDEEPDPFGSVPPHTSGEPPFSHGGSHPPPPPPPPHGPPPSSIPDDSNYDPAKSDPMLFVLSKDWTKLAKAAPATDLSHDHMTRFNINDESPRNVSSMAPVKGDWFIICRDRNGTQKYVVTYTRKSRKPIFNRVT